MGKAVNGNFQSRNIISVSRLACLRTIKEELEFLNGPRNPEVGRMSPRDLVEGDFWEENCISAFDSS